MSQQKKKSLKYKRFSRSTLRHALMWGDYTRQNGGWNKSDTHTYFLIKEEIKRLGHQYYLEQKKRNGDSKNHKRTQEKSKTEACEKRNEKG